ncbi:MAG: hypothetical protein HY905_02790 [Deltaproteobacteria bacterium]|nr:hypothetical protein [Deltaproteobacteria bacterium]
MNPAPAPEPPASGSSRLARLRPWLPAALAAALALAYLPSLGGGFLNYDDDWLVEHNHTLRDPSPSALLAAWTDFTPGTRLTLGAEYLPLRDTLVWLELRLFGPHAPPMRVTSLFLFLAAALLVRRYLLRTFGDGIAAEAAAWLFALHPVHAESVAWLAGQKDLVALLFVAAALVSYAGNSRRRALLVPSLVALACLGKAVAVVTPLLLLAHDLLVRRKPSARVLVPSFAVALAAAAVHGWVGHVVGMVAEPLGGSRLAAFVSMGPATWDCLARCLVPTGLSVLHDAPVRSAADLLGWLAVANFVALGAVAALRWRAGDRRPAVFLAWFLIPLAPTAQFLVPLQNAVADRYLLLAVLGPVAAIGAALAWLASRDRPRLALACAVALCASFALSTFERAAVFHDSVALFRDATARTAVDPLAPYQLGKALQAAGDPQGAERAFLLAFSRPGSRDVRCSAANNLAVLLSGKTRLGDGIAFLRHAVTVCPDNPKTHNGLAELLARAGFAAEARAAYDDLVRRFPDYEVGLRNYERRYGSPPQGPDEKKLR